MPTFDAAEQIRTSGLENSRDFQVGLVQAWHNQTKIVPKIQRSDFPEIVPAQVYYGDDYTPATGYFLPVSKDDNRACGKVFNVDTYSLFTPQNAFDFVGEILAGTGFTIESVGMISNRSRWFISVKLDELLSILPGFKPFLNWNGSLDGTMSPGAQLFIERTVCRNSLRRSRSSGEILFRAKATKNFRGKLDSAKAEIERAVGMTRVFTETLKRMETIPASETTAREIYAGFIAPEDTKELSTRAQNLTGELVTLFGPRGLGNKGETVADVLNGFTQARTRGIDGSTKDVWGQFESSEFGTFAAQKEEFFDVLANDASRETTRQRGQFLLANSVN